MKLISLKSIQQTVIPELTRATGTTKVVVLNTCDVKPGTGDKPVCLEGSMRGVSYHIKSISLEEDSFYGLCYKVKTHSGTIILPFDDSSITPKEVGFLLER